MAKFIRIDDRIINVDSISSVELNYDGCGGMVIHMPAASPPHERNTYGAGLSAQDRMFQTALICHGERAESVKKILLAECVDLTPAKTEPAKKERMTTAPAR